MGVLSQLTWRARAVIRPPVTFGVRCIVIDQRDRVLLVRHTYMAGWHFPGGAVDAGESAADAARREVAEESGLALTGPLAFFGLYFHRAMAGRDHIAVFTALDRAPIDTDALRPQALEIAAVQMAPLSALPEETSPATRRRLAELAGGAALDEIW